jgi:acetyl-CoA carboxylase biotin carboxyl carrier protein
MDIKDIKSIIRIVTESDITEFELESGGEKIRIQRGKPLDTLQYVPQQRIAYEQTAASPQVQPLPEVAPPVTVQPTPGSGKTQNITSPIVGTLYRAPAPDAPPYVEAGQTVEKGQVLCIVEAMKLMNEIEAEFRCKIVRICKENAQPVEYGETLFIVEPL